MAYRNYGPANGFVVSKDGTGDFTTIAAALAAAPANTTIFLKPGTYTENNTISTVCNIAAWSGDSGDGTGNVIINGTLTVTAAITVNISNIYLQTNSAVVIAVSGNSASVVNLNNCFINCSNNTGITLSSSSASSQINLYQCNGNLGATGIGLFAHSGAGLLMISNGFFTNTANSTTASTVSGSGTIQALYSILNLPIATSSTAGSSLFYTCMDTSGPNSISFTVGGTGSNVFVAGRFAAGTASPISVSSSCTLTINNSVIDSGNTNAITGNGTVKYAGITFQGLDTTINTTTQTGGTIQGGVTQAPSAGFIGERISSIIPLASAVNINTTTVTNLTSINLTPGIWDIALNICFTDTSATVSVFFEAGIGPNSASLTGIAVGDNGVEFPGQTLSSSDVCLTIPSYRVTLTSTTTYFAIADVNYSTGQMKMYGRLSAVRVG